MTDVTAPQFSAATVAPATSACDLCGLRLPKRFYTAEFQQAEHHFCCAGCRQVFLLLCESGVIEGDFKSSELYQTSLRLGIISRPEEETPADAISNEELKDAQEMVLHVEGMWCSACSWLIEKVVAKEPGVVQARVIYAADTAKVHYKPEQISSERIAAVINKLGYVVTPRAAASEAHYVERKALLLKMGVAFFLMMNIAFFTYVIYVGYFQELAPEIQRLIPLVLLALTAPAVFWCGAPIHQKAWRSLRAQAPTMELLLSLGIFAAFFYSVYAIMRGDDHFYFDTAANLVALVLLGKFIEVTAKHKASANINRLYQMLPKKVRLQAQEGQRLVAIEKLQVGDHFIVKSGEKIPADGRIVSGTAVLDESLLTGESRPIDKRVGDHVTGSAMLLNGHLIVEALRVGEDTFLSQLIKMVESALVAKSPLERLVDRLARVFIPFVLTLALGTVLVLVLTGVSVEAAILRAITVLVIACPCALGMATPLALAAGIGFAAKRGILIRDGAALQLAGKTSHVVFDKTGTLTEGKFALLGVHGGGVHENETLRLLASLEQASNHPLATAIVEACEEKRLARYGVEEVQLVEGRGLSGLVLGAQPTRVVIGNEAFVREHNFILPREQRELVEREAEIGRTIVFFGLAGNLHAGYLVLGDSLQRGVLEVVAQLKQLGVAISLLSGDGAHTTAAVARQAGIADFIAQALPEEKIKTIRALQAQGKIVAMVGDGVNDAPALAQAEVGMAMGNGTEIARESAPLIMMREDLQLVPEAIAISQRTVRTIKQNLTWAFFYNAIGIGIALAGWLNPLMAAAAMLSSSLSVIGNSMRLHEGRGKTWLKLREILLPWWEPASVQ